MRQLKLSTFSIFLFKSIFRQLSSFTLHLCVKIITLQCCNVITGFQKSARHSDVASLRYLKLRQIQQAEDDHHVKVWVSSLVVSIQNKVWSELKIRYESESLYASDTPFGWSVRRTQCKYLRYGLGRPSETIQMTCLMHKLMRNRSVSESTAWNTENPDVQIKTFYRISLDSLWINLDVHYKSCQTDN